MHVEKGLGKFKSQTASVCDKIARSRHQGAPLLLSPNCAERPPDSVMQATDAVDALQVLKRTWMQALDYIIKRDSLEQTDHGCHCLILAGWHGRHRSVQAARTPLALRQLTWVICTFHSIARRNFSKSLKVVMSTDTCWRHSTCFNLPARTFNSFSELRITVVARFPMDALRYSWERRCQQVKHSLLGVISLQHQLALVCF